MSSFIDHAVLFSGDGDFKSLVEAVQRRGVRVSVVSSLRTQPAMVADDLRRQADNFIELSEMAERIARRFEDRNGGRLPRQEIDDEDDDPGEAVVIRR
jgi:uncharacterized LabA/DUF88 family protein